MTSFELHQALNVHHLPLQLDDYTSFLQEYSDTILLTPQAEEFDIILKLHSDHFDEYDYGYNFEEHHCFLEEQSKPQHQRRPQDKIQSNSLEMSNQQSSFHSQSYSSSTFSSTSNGEAPKTWRNTEHTETNPSGTTIRRTSEQPGQAPTQEMLHYDSEGKAIEQSNDNKKIEDVTDADREYLERMEDEYAKREGGA
jgi:hypothetical protein